MNGQRPSQRVVIYCRANPRSSAEIAEHLGDQERRCAEHVERNGWQVVEVVRDVSVSGGIERAGLRSLTREVLTSHSDIVLVDTLQRISSDMRQIHAFLGQMEALDVELKVVASP